MLLRAINPQNIRPTDVESITFESHPLVEQVLLPPLSSSYPRTPPLLIPLGG